MPQHSSMKIVKLLTFLINNQSRTGVHIEIHFFLLTVFFNLKGWVMINITYLLWTAGGATYQQ